MEHRIDQARKQRRLATARGQDEEAGRLHQEVTRLDDEVQHLITSISDLNRHLKLAKARGDAGGR